MTIVQFFFLALIVSVYAVLFLSIVVHLAAALWKAWKQQFAPARSQKLNR